MKKIICFLMTVLIIFTLCACSDELDEKQVGKDMEQVLTELFSAVQKQDKNSFISFFDDDVSAQLDFENGCQYVFDTYQGELVGVDFLSAGHTGKLFVQGEQICYAYMSFRIITSENEYEVCVEFYTQYESKYPNDPYKIRQFSIFPKLDDGSFIPKESDGNFSEDWIAFGQRHGIYYPGWRDEEITS